MSRPDPHCSASRATDRTRRLVPQSGRARSDRSHARPEHRVVRRVRARQSRARVHGVPRRAQRCCGAHLASRHGVRRPSRSGRDFLGSCWSRRASGLRRTDPLQDWLPVGAPHAEIHARLLALSRAADARRAAAGPPILDDDGLLHVGDSCVLVPAFERALAEPLVAHFERPVAAVELPGPSDSVGAAVAGHSCAAAREPVEPAGARDRRRAGGSVRPSALRPSRECPGQRGRVDPRRERLTSTARVGSRVVARCPLTSGPGFLPRSRRGARWRTGSVSVRCSDDELGPVGPAQRGRLIGASSIAGACSRMSWPEPASYS